MQQDIIGELNKYPKGYWDFKGKITMLNFWATWCPPCRQEMPHFQSVFEEIMENPDRQRYEEERLQSTYRHQPGDFE